MRILAVGDEVDEALCDSGAPARLAPDLVLSCGDLPPDYLEFLSGAMNAPLVYVPGNHDPDLRGAPPRIDPGDFTNPFSFRPRRRTPPRRVEGCSLADGRIVELCGLRIMGLGGSVRYREGPNQYTQAQMHRRALRLQAQSLVAGRPDILLTHAPPQGLGDDGDDPVHQGFAAFNYLVRRLAPRILVHGHVHPYGNHVPDRVLGTTTIVNAVGHRILEVPE